MPIASMSEVNGVCAQPGMAMETRPGQFRQEEEFFDSNRWYLLHDIGSPRLPDLLICDSQRESSSVPDHMTKTTRRSGTPQVFFIPT
jgi:hypothetical protein